MDGFGEGNGGGVIGEVIVVEGKSDVAAIRRAVEADCLITGGFSLSPELLGQIDAAYRRRGIIIMTDPDSAGERIRTFLRKRFPEAGHAFIPRTEAVGEDGPRIQDLRLPEGSVITLITRGDKVISPNGGTQLRGGDRITVLAHIRNEEALLHALLAPFRGDAPG